jgi:hypothetical protein
MVLGKKKKATRVQFNYHHRTAEEVRAHVERKTGGGEDIFKDEYEQFKPEEGDNAIRILPREAKHFGLECVTHEFYETFRGRYLCLRSNAHLRKPQACPMCEAAKSKTRKDDDMEGLAMRRVVYWILDRAERDKIQPKLYMVSNKRDKDIAALTQDRRKGNVLDVDAIDEGYDFYFTRKGADRRTQYTGNTFDRDPTPISDDDDEINEVLAYVKENPLEDCLVFKDAKYLEDLLTGSVPEEEEEEEEEKERPAKRFRRERLRDGEEDEEEEDDEPQRKRAARSRRDQEEADAGDEGEEGDEEEEADTRSAKGRVKDKKRSRRDEEDEDEDEDEADEPRSKRAKRSTDEDEDDDDDDRPQRRGSSKRASKDEDEDEADEEERPRRSQRGHSARAPVRTATRTRFG